MFTLALIATIAFIIYGFWITLALVVAASNFNILMKAFTKVASATQDPS